MFVAELDILNCNTGHIEFKFDKDDKKEVERAKKAITDMLERGYILIIEEEGGKFSRVDKFDPKHDCYIVKELPRGRKATRKVPIRKAKATSIAPVRGG